MSHLYTDLFFNTCKIDLFVDGPSFNSLDGQAKFCMCLFSGDFRDYILLLRDLF